ncbi:MAG: carboxypeptidase regulatory-like domain-containing protein, partial [Blastocatellia bacterium]
MFKSNSYRMLCAAMLFALCFAFGGAQAFAQANASAGQVVGTVRDSNGAAVAGARIRIVNTQTGLEQTATAGEDGLFRFVLLPSGTYNLTAEAANFAKSELTGIKVTVGQVTDANLMLGVAAVSEAITVTAEAVQTTVSQPDAIISQTQIDNLPINGRRFQDFVTLTPTAQVDPSRGQISLSGQRGINANVSIDGVDYNQPFFGGLRGGERSNSVFTIPQESVKEFQVIAAGYSAEFGRSTGGLVTAITKSGTNALHGSAFYLIRPQELARSNAFYDTLARSLKRDIVVSPTQQQFGGSIGGPIRKDKMFFFGSYEQQRFRNPRQVFFDPLSTFTPTPATQEAFDFYKTLQVPFEQTNDAKAGLFRFDWNISDRNRFNVRYNQSYANALNSTSVGSTVYNQPAINNALSNNGTEQDKSYTVVGQFTTTINSNLINELRGQYSREVRPRLANAEAANVSNTIGRFGTVNFLPTTQFDYRIQAFDNLTWLLGNHSVKMGAEGNQVFASQVFGFNQFGVFGSSTNDTATILDVLSFTPGITGGAVNRFDSTTANYLRQIGNLQASYDVQQFSLFVQDAWRVRPNFTLNYGLRWEGQFNPAPEANNDIILNQIRG